MPDRWLGVSSVLGGALVGISAVLMAQRPAGVVGGAHRESDDLGIPIFAGMLLLSLMGIVLYFIVETIEKLTIGWHVSQRMGVAA